MKLLLLAAGLDSVLFSFGEGCRTGPWEGRGDCTPPVDETLQCLSAKMLQLY